MKKTVIAFMLFGFILSGCEADTLEEEIVEEEETVEIEKIEVELSIGRDYLYNESRTGRYILIEPKEGDAFHWPYYIYVPNLLNHGDTTYLLVEGGNSPYADDDFTCHVEHAENSILRTGHVFGRFLKDPVPVLMPVFPRFETGEYADKKWLSPQRLKAGTLTRGEGKFQQFDLQLIAMVEDAKERFEEMGLQIHEQFIIYGFSGAGAFANRMVLLHPEKIHAAAFGGLSCPSVPVSEWGNTYIPYPTGIGGLKEITGEEFKMEEFKKTPLFIFRGSEDYTDFYEFSRPSYVMNVFGELPPERVNVAKEIYESIGANAVFKMYEGVGHKVTNEMITDIRAFFDENLE